MTSFLFRWFGFVNERFPPLRHLALVGSFSLGNAVVAGSFAAPAPLGGRFFLVFAAMMFLFLRLRIFDEIKDVLTDRQINPSRPLARGAISVREAKGVAFGLAGAEFIFLSPLGVPGLVTWIVVFMFSLLMYREFFMGAWLRPRMELYAVMHTFVAGLMGLLITGCLSRSLHWSWEVWMFVLANWGVFNVFEFARKTYGVEEEESADSYSKRLGRWGAVFICQLNVWLAVGVAWWLLVRAGVLGKLWVMGLIGLTLTVSVLYGFAGSGRCARWYRAIMGLFLLGYYLVVAGALAGGLR
jgi:4-hydroxybenzoate polyprenyltransferase